MAIALILKSMLRKIQFFMQIILTLAGIIFDFNILGNDNEVVRSSFAPDHTKRKNSRFIFYQKAG